MLFSKSMKNFNFRSEIDDQIQSGDLDGALKYIEHIVDYVFCEPLNTAQIFGDRSLDEFCEKIGSYSIGVLKARQDFGCDLPMGGNVIVASKLQASGGHTAVLADIACRMKGPVTIIITGVVGRTDINVVRHIFGNVQDLKFLRVPPGNRLSKLQWIQACLWKISPKVVWLANHHQDSVAVSAVQPGQSYILKYLHHGDHHLCLGVHLSFGEHYDLHSMGFWNCRDELKKNNKYLPLIVEDPGCMSSGVDEINFWNVISCTAASKNKVEHNYWPNYAETIADVLSVTGGVHFHVGRLSWFYRQRINRALAKKGVPINAFEYIAYVPSVARFLQERKVNLYIASFPYAGARTSVEAMAAGVAIAGHDHSSKKFLGAVDMLPPGSFVWTRPDQLMDFLSKTDRARLHLLGGKARQHYENYHFPEKLLNALSDGVSECGFPQKPLKSPVDELNAALLRADQFSLVGLLGRKGLRCFRAFKSSLSRFV